MSSFHDPLTLVWFVILSTSAAKSSVHSLEAPQQCPINFESRMNGYGSVLEDVKSRQIDGLEIVAVQVELFQSIQSLEIWRSQCR